MALAPKFASSHIIGGVTTAAAAYPNTIELYLDYVCPFSAKLFKTVYNQVIPKLKELNQDSKFKWVFRNYIQPWHPSSTLVHEAAIAVGMIDPDKFWKFSNALFIESNQYYDSAVYNESRGETYLRLAKFVERQTGIKQDKFLEFVKISTTRNDQQQPHNNGNKVTNDVKLFVKVGRQNSIHVTPTVVVNGIIAPNVSSSFSLEEWIEYLGSL